MVQEKSKLSKAILNDDGSFLIVPKWIYNKGCWRQSWTSEALDWVAVFGKNVELPLWAKKDL